jgi:hypothetical protein
MRSDVLDNWLRWLNIPFGIQVRRQEPGDAWLFDWKSRLTMGEILIESDESFYRFR